MIVLDIMSFLIAEAGNENWVGYESGGTMEGSI